MTLFRRLGLFLCLMAAAADVRGADAELDRVIALAREYLGGEAALNAVRSVRFEGTMETVEKTESGLHPLRATLRIHFQAPYRQRIELELPDRLEVTALNDYEGWQRIEARGEPGSRPRITLLGKDQIRRLRANTWENLAFFRGLAERGGRVDNLGLAEQDGRVLRKVAFAHADTIIFYRYFDERTGRLVLTETEKGGRIREEGELWADGVRFPSKIITVNTLADGSRREVTVVFDRVVVNELQPDSYFALPPWTSR